MEIDMNNTTEPLNRNIPTDTSGTETTKKKIILPPAYPVTLHCSDCKCRRNYCKI